MLRRLWCWLVGHARRPKVIMWGYGRAFVDDNGNYKQELTEEFCDSLEAAGIDQLLWPEGMVGLYDDGRGHVMRVGGRDSFGVE